MTDITTCSGCRFFRPTRPGDCSGFCHHSPPKMVRTGKSRVESFFPFVAKPDWGCGKKEDAAPAPDARPTALPPSAEGPHPPIGSNAPF